MALSEAVPVAMGGPVGVAPTVVWRIPIVAVFWSHNWLVVAPQMRGKSREMMSEAGIEKSRIIATRISNELKRCRYCNLPLQPRE
jgi:hypothetical protein